MQACPLNCARYRDRHFLSVLREKSRQTRFHSLQCHARNEQCVYSDLDMSDADEQQAVDDQSMDPQVEHDDSQADVVEEETRSQDTDDSDLDAEVQINIIPDEQSMEPEAAPEEENIKKPEVVAANVKNLKGQFEPKAGAAAGPEVKSLIKMYEQNVGKVSKGVFEKK